MALADSIYLILKGGYLVFENRLSSKQLMGERICGCNFEQCIVDCIPQNLVNILCVYQATDAMPYELVCVCPPLEATRPCTIVPI